MKKLDWRYDDDTAWWAKEVGCVVDIGSREPAPQYDGKDDHLVAENWRQYILAPAFPEYCEQQGRLECSPYNILRCIRDDHLLEALVLVIGWGGKSMWAKNARTYRSGMGLEQAKHKIRRTLAQCCECIERDSKVDSAWDLAVNGLDWTDTMTSKYLHFLARALGYETAPPVPIDGEIIVGKAWPLFKNMILQRQGSAGRGVPGVWRHKSSWDAYNRYMTAINCWAEMKQGWSTTDVECTIFYELWTAPD